jgi:hypothetical protein
VTIIFPNKNREVGKVISTWKNQYDAYQSIVAVIQELLKKVDLKVFVILLFICKSLVCS